MFNKLKVAVADVWEASRCGSKDACVSSAPFHKMWAQLGLKCIAMQTLKMSFFQIDFHVLGDLLWLSVWAVQQNTQPGLFGYLEWIENQCSSNCEHWLVLKHPPWPSKCPSNSQYMTPLMPGTRSVCFQCRWHITHMFKMYIWMYTIPLWKVAFNL